MLALNKKSEFFSDNPVYNDGYAWFYNYTKQPLQKFHSKNKADDEDIKYLNEKRIDWCVNMNSFCCRHLYGNYVGYELKIIY